MIHTPFREAGSLVLDNLTGGIKLALLHSFDYAVGCWIKHSGGLVIGAEAHRTPATATAEFGTYFVFFETGFIAFSSGYLRRSEGRNFSMCGVYRRSVTKGLQRGQSRGFTFMVLFRVSQLGHTGLGVCEPSCIHSSFCAECFSDPGCGWVACIALAACQSAFFGCDLYTTLEEDFMPSIAI